MAKKYTNYQLVLSASGSWTASKIVITYKLTYNDGTTSTSSVTHTNQGWANPYIWPAAQNYNGANDPEWLRLKQTFGDQIVYKDGAIVWKGETMQGIANGEGTARLGKSTSALLSHFSGIDREHMENTSLTLSGEWVEQHAAKHIGTNEKDPRNIPLRPCDFELIPAMWRNPDNVARGKYAGSSVLQLETFDGGMLNLAIDEDGQLDDDARPASAPAFAPAHPERLLD